MSKSILRVIWGWTHLGIAAAGRPVNSIEGREALIGGIGQVAESITAVREAGAGRSSRHLNYNWNVPAETFVRLYSKPSSVLSFTGGVCDLFSVVGSTVVTAASPALQVVQQRFHLPRMLNVSMPRPPMMRNLIFWYSVLIHFKYIFIL